MRAIRFLSIKLTHTATMRQRTNKLNNSKSGQMVIEMILVMTVLVGVVGLVQVSLQKNEAFKTLVQGPWKVLSGMIVAGTWKAPDQAVIKHPAYWNNHGSLRGEQPQ